MFLKFSWRYWALLTIMKHQEFAQSAKVQRTDLCWDPQTASSATLKTTRRSKPALVSDGRPPKIKPGSVFLGKVLAIKKGS